MDLFADGTNGRGCARLTELGPAILPVKLRIGIMSINAIIYLNDRKCSYITIGLTSVLTGFWHGWFGNVS